MSGGSEKYDREDPLRGIYWRDEILQLVYWMKGEGFAEEVRPSDLIRFLDLNEQELQRCLDTLVEEGYLEATHERYRLTPMGDEEGRRRFVDEFAPMLKKPGHEYGECSRADCDCHESEAAREECRAWTEDG